MALDPGVRLHSGLEINAEIAAEIVASTAAKAAAASVTVATPATGATVTMTGGHPLFVDPTGTIATLTVKLPAAPAAGDIAEMSFSEIVTALTVQDSAAGAVASTAGAVGVAQQYRFVGGAWVLWR